MILNAHNGDELRSWWNITGIVNEQTEAPKVDWDLKTPASVFSSSLGTEKLRQLHRGNKFWDLGLIVLAWALLVVNWYFLATLEIGVLWIFLALLQSGNLAILFYGIRHDTFMHRQFGGKKISFIGGLIMSLPMFSTYSRFLKHADHHAHIGYDLFEERLAELDRVWKRWFCLTIIGLICLGSGLLQRRDFPQPNKHWKEPAILKKMQLTEWLVQFVWYASLIVLALYSPALVLKGFVVPVLLFSPLFYSLKCAGQHAETDPHNAYHAAVYIETNQITRILFYFSLGDSHLVHHFFPRIPTWKLGQAADLLRSDIRKHDVPKRGLSEVLISYYFEGEPYRERWQTKRRKWMQQSEIKYTATEWPRIRNLLSDFLKRTAKRQKISGFFEIDITHPKKVLSDAQRQYGRSFSFMAYLIWCYAKAVDQNKGLQGVKWKNKIIAFDDVDVNFIIEKKTESGERMPTIHIFRAANKRTYAQINEELKTALKENIHLTEVIKKRMRLLYLPAWVRAIIWSSIEKKPFLRKSNSGTVGFTSVHLPGGNRPYWAQPVTVLPVTLAIGGAFSKPMAINGEVEIRKMLCATVTVDHYLIDGAPAVRFGHLLCDQIESAKDLVFEAP